MSFKFNFFGDDKENKENAQNDLKESNQKTKDATVINYIPSSINLLFSQWKELTVGSVKYYYMKDVDTSSISEDVLRSNTGDTGDKDGGLNTDLIPGVYEGGFEVWECTVDLLNFLQNNIDVVRASPSVLDLGCGSGLLGICAKLTSPQSTVHFQDFNSEVITNFTIKNYHKNCGHHNSHNVQFCAGDWSNMSSIFATYDLILTAETIYSVDSQKKVMKILEEHLSEMGVAYVGSKRHYFGVGGGVVDFQDLVKQSGTLRCDVVWSCEGGLLRDILRVSRC